MASLHGNIDVVGVLIKSGADLGTGVFSDNRLHENTVLQAAAAVQDWNLVWRLLNKGKDINFTWDAHPSVLMSACFSRLLPVVGELLERGANLHHRDSKSQTALHMAVKAGHKSVARYLIDKGADIDVWTTFNESPLTYACASGDLHMVDMILDASARVNDSSARKIPSVFRNALETACLHGHTAVVNRLLDAGADILSDDGLAESAFRSVIRSGNEEIFKLLIERGANISFRDYWSRPFTTDPSGRHLLDLLYNIAGATARE